MTPKQVAQWMVEQLKRVKYLHQHTAAYEIRDSFGEEFTYINQHGNLSINREVLREFRSLTEGAVVWERGERLWRMKEEYDPDNKRQVH